MPLATLGLPAIVSLSIVAWLDVVREPRTSVMSAFPKLFLGLGDFRDPYEIKVKEGAEPFALYTPRRVPLALHKDVKAELDRMQSLGVISPVEVTPWCAGMVVVPKA